jgi:alkylation response protein AidB-like acyl-CoA dehydrogenase
MRATFTEEQHALAEVADDLATSGRPEHPRAGDPVPEAAATTASLREGFAGLGVPEDNGGAGGGLVELTILLHALGRQVVPTRFASHVLATQVALAAGLDVTAAASGEQVWTLALHRPGTDGPWPGTGSLRPRVPHAADADAVVAFLDDDVAILTGCTVTDEPGTLDLGRPAGTVTLDGDVTQRAAAPPATIQRAWLLNAAELVGVGRGAVDLATDYAKQRQQFGQPIGRFQGVAHQLADALVAVENAWSLVLYAAWAVDAEAPDATSAVHVAAASASEAAVFASERCTQVHGGIGITWEAMPHLYLRRAITGAAHAPDWHREQAGRRILATVTA